MVELHFVRTYAAPRQLVWDAWTDPDQMAQWWGPRGVSTPRESIELDLRPGGVMRVRHGRRRHRRPLCQQRPVPRGRAARPDRVVRRRLPGWLGQGHRDITLEVVDEATTRLTVHIAADFTETIRANAEVGWGTQLDKLVDFLAAAQA